MSRLDEIRKRWTAPVDGSTTTIDLTTVLRDVRHLLDSLDRLKAAVGLGLDHLEALLLDTDPEFLPLHSHHLTQEWFERMDHLTSDDPHPYEGFIVTDPETGTRTLSRDVLRRALEQVRERSYEPTPEMMRRRVEHALGLDTVPTPRILNDLDQIRSAVDEGFALDEGPSRDLLDRIDRLRGAIALHAAATIRTGRGIHEHDRVLWQAVGGDAIDAALEDSDE